MNEVLYTELMIALHVMGNIQISIRLLNGSIIAFTIKRMRLLDSNQFKGVALSKTNVNILICFFCFSTCFKQVEWGEQITRRTHQFTTLA